MVTVVPSLNRGASIGEALGRGGAAVAKGKYEQQLKRDQLQYERGLLQTGLDEAKETFNNKESSATDKLFAYQKAFAGIPGGDRTQAALLPVLLADARATASYGKGQNGQGSQGNTDNGSGNGVSNIRPGNQISSNNGGNQIPGQSQDFNQMNAQENGEIPINDSLDRGLADVGQINPNLAGAKNPPMEGGILPHIKSTEDMRAEAIRLHQINPQIPMSQFFADQLQENALAEGRRAQAEQQAKKLGISDADMPEFFALGEQNANARSIPEWAKKTEQLFREYKAATKTLEGIAVPGILNASERQEYIGRAGDTMRLLQKMGREADTFTWGAKNGLTMFEMQNELYPASFELKKAVHYAPRGMFPINDEKGKPHQVSQYNKFLEQGNEKEILRSNYGLSQWMRQNLKPEDSLLVMRDKLMRDKDYDWKQFGQALAMAMQGENGIKLSAHQIAEHGDFATQGPRDALPLVLKDLSRIYDYNVGKK